MMKLILLVFFLCANRYFAQKVSESESVPQIVNKCSNDALLNCNLQCFNGDYVLNEDGCPTCACAKQVLEDRSKIACPMMKCRANCGDLGYVIDENGCQTCKCASDTQRGSNIPPKTPVECSRVMCRMFCVNGFRRDENGCEVCQCNDEPQPCPVVDCQNLCPNGYRKDYSGCQTCQCEDIVVPQQPDVNVDGCSPMKCNLDCKYGFERDLSGCPLCSCNVCPLQTCRMFCMYGFKKNSDGCDLCECNWAPVSENIPCSDRVPCTGYRVCNANLRLCETVSADKVNWFVYNFDVRSDLFRDQDFILAFKRGLINNIAGKYDLEPGQIAVSAVEPDSTTSFQIMPYNSENLDEFQQKMDQIDADLGSNEFRNVLPSVANIAKKPTPVNRWNGFLQSHPRIALYLVAIAIGLVALIVAGIFTMFFRGKGPYHRTESKVPIYESSYHPAPTDDDHYQAVHAPDGTAYVVVESEDMITSNDKRALV